MLLCYCLWQKLLCTYAFPQCGTWNGYNIGLPLCYEDCIAVSESLCFTDWSLIELNKQKGRFLKSRGHFRLPNCSELPKYKVNNNGPTCSYAGLTEMKKEEVTCKLMNKYGIFFC